MAFLQLYIMVLFWDFAAKHRISANT